MKGHSVEPETQGVSVFWGSGLFKSKEVCQDPILIDALDEVFVSVYFSSHLDMPT